MIVAFSFAKTPWHACIIHATTAAATTTTLTDEAMQTLPTPHASAKETHTRSKESYINKSNSLRPARLCYKSGRNLQR